MDEGLAPCTLLAVVSTMFSPCRVSRVEVRVYTFKQEHFISRLCNLGVQAYLQATGLQGVVTSLIRRPRPLKNQSPTGT